MKIEQLLEKGSLKKARPDKEKAIQSIKVAESKLEESERSLAAHLYESAVVFAYMAMFHAARAILFQDGYTEKSHFAIAVYLQEKHPAKLGLDLINKFNTQRVMRHEGLYGLDTDFKKEDAELAIKDAKEFLKKIKELIKQACQK
ncbi:MAG: HEPN domain-containing protein [Nanoarchaeota archaeon]|nr:HEPN domain-containing protein [Nanoarchaeota archaeon]